MFVTSMVLELLVTQRVLTFLSSSFTNSPLFLTLTPHSAEQNKCSAAALSALHHHIASSAEPEFPAPAKTLPIMDVCSGTPITFLKDKI